MENIRLFATVCSQALRDIGITAYLENGGTIAAAQQTIVHKSPETTKFRDRTSD